MGEPTDTTDDLAGGSVSVREPPEEGFDAVSGLDHVEERLREAVVTPATNDRLAAFGASGVLVHGPPGVGKTHLTEALLGELAVPYLEVTPADIPLAEQDTAAAYVRDLYARARSSEPGVVFVDGLDVVAPAADDGRFEQVITELANVLDELDDRGETLFVATTTELGAVDERVRRAGRIDITIALERPDFRRRRQLLADELAAVETAGLSVAEIDLDRVAGWTDGFSAAELAEVVERGARKADDALREDTLADAVEELHDVESFRADDEACRDDESEQTEAGTDDDRDGIDIGEYLEGEGVTGRDGQRGTVIEGAATPDVAFADIGGLDAAKQRLREVVEWPRTYPEQFDRLDVDTARGILLYGPPGTGKTLLAKAIANETESTFISVDGPELLDRYVGESERFVRQLFEAAQELAPAVVFIDEIDAIAGSRGGYVGGGGVQDSIVNQILAELDGLTSLEGVVVVGATNRIEVIDPALRRPGRFGEAIHVPPPTDEGRREVFEIHTSERDLAADVDVDWLVAETDSAYTGADVAAICERAAMNAIRELVEEGGPGAETEACPITRSHFRQAIDAVDPSSTGDGETDSRAFR